tara:strand:- start:372 stop:776 length:405 start_codon:yes stop_codon:yes gene_type:complete
MTRVFQHRIKRILDHQTYNTETATEIAGFADKALFQTRYDTYFIATALRSVFDIRPVTLEQAKFWLEEYFPCRELPSDDQQSEYRTTIRMPSDLKLRIDASAKRQALSVNAWLVRCLEIGVSLDNFSATKGEIA